jgi:hypothetical protein
MVQSILVDSDVLIDFSRGVDTVADYLAELSTASELCISAITQIEMMVGCPNKRALQALDRFLIRFEVVYLDEAISIQALKLLQQYNLSHGLLIPDALIAATAVESGQPLLTKNQRDFRFIQDLVLLPLPSVQ